MQEEIDVLVQTVDKLIKRVDSLEESSKQTIATEREIRILQRFITLSLFLQAGSTFFRYVLVPFILSFY